jgi:uncharacterized protein
MSEEIALTTPTGRLFGTLELPSESHLVPPVALIWAGSGPTDRDGNSHLGIRARSLRLLAEGLAEAGIASLRTDKRGVADSMAAAGDEEARTLQSYVDDAAVWIDHLRADERFGKVILIGHSEGASVMAMAAALRPVEAMVSLAGPGRPMSTLLREQLASQARSGRMPQAFHGLALKYIDQLERGERVDHVDPRLAMAFRPSIQPFLMSLFGFDPLEAARNLTVPFLIVQGTADNQVSVLDASALQAARQGSKLAIIEGMNHILKAESSDPARGARQLLDPKEPLAHGLVDAIMAFVQQLGASTARPTAAQKGSSPTLGDGKKPETFAARAPSTSGSRDN